MSLNQSRAEKSEAQVRKPGRSGSSNYQRSSSGGAGKGGSGTAPPLSPSISSSPSLSTNRGFKKSGNGQGGQSKVGPASTNSEPNAAIAANRAVQNGTHVQSHVHGVSDMPVSVTAKPIDSSVPRSSRSLPKAPSSQTTSGASDSAVPATPLKGDAPRAFPPQFGTISPGFMNGMQIPARTSSAPPNLDEQKRDQERHNSVRGVPTMPIPPVLKQWQMRKDVGSMNQSNTASSHPQPQAKRDIHIPIPAAPAATAQKSSSTTTSSGSIDADPTSSHYISSVDAQEDKSSTADASKIKSEIRTPDQEASEKVSGLSCQETAPAMLSDSSESAQKLEGRSAYNMSSGPVSTSLSASKDRISLEQNRAKGAAGKKKKRREFLLKVSGLSCQETAPAMLSDSSESAQKLEGRSAYNMSSGPVSTSSSASKDRISLEQNRAKGALAAGKKKKRREFLLKADTAGTSSHLYMAYKGPEEKPETAITPEIVDSTSDVKQVSADATEKDLLATEDDAHSKVEIDDWEDVVEISSPKLKTLENGEYGSGVSGKKYSKDFLLTFSEQYTDLPLGLEIGFDIVHAIMSGPVANSHLVERESHPSSGFKKEKSSGPVSTTLSASKDRISLDRNRAKGAAGKKKKRREFLLKADAAGTSSDLYMACKGPEEKPETAITSELVDSTSDVKQESADATEKDLLATEDDAQSKAEIDDWEDLVEISSPKLKTLKNGEYGSGVSGKKYPKDFLLTFSEQNTDLPLGFEIGSDIVDAIMSGPVANSHLVEPKSYQLICCYSAKKKKKKKKEK